MDAGPAPFAEQLTTTSDDAPSARGRCEERRRRRGASCLGGLGRVELALAHGFGVMALLDPARADETVEHDLSTEGAGWRSPTLWGSLVIIISGVMGMALSKVYVSTQAICGCGSQAFC